jgi:hypothetical protein
MEREVGGGNPKLRLVAAGVLVVAIVVVGAYAGSMLVGDLTDPTPNATFTHEYDNGTVTVTHAGGDPFTTEETARLELSSPEAETTTTWAADADAFPVEEGDSARITGVEPGVTVRVIWTGTGEEPSFRVLERFEISDE